MTYTIRENEVLETASANVIINLAKCSDQNIYFSNKLFFSSKKLFSPNNFFYNSLRVMLIEDLEEKDDLLNEWMNELEGVSPVDNRPSTFYIANSEAVAV